MENEYLKAIASVVLPAQILDYFTEFGIFADFAPTLFKVLTNQTEPIVAIQDMPIDKDKKNERVGLFP